MLQSNVLTCFGAATGSELGGVWGQRMLRSHLGMRMDFPLEIQVDAFKDMEETVVATLTWSTWTELHSFSKQPQNQPSAEPGGPLP